MSKKKELLTSAWTPAANFPFRATGTRNLKFQYRWLQRWNWLAYSRKENGRRILLVSARGLPSGKLVMSKFDNWKNGIEAFNEHEQKSFHRNSVLGADNFLAISEGKKTLLIRILTAG
ncbi:hypothetical protein MTO96_039951 [Rhipicephalus appendiculatus]